MSVLMQVRIAITINSFGYRLSQIGEVQNFPNSELRTPNLS